MGSCNHKGPEKWRNEAGERENREMGPELGIIGGFADGGGATRQGMRAALESGRKQMLSGSLQEGGQPRRTLDCGPVRPELHF